MKIKRSDLNECIAEAIVKVVRESWEDDVVNAAMNDKKAKKAFEKDSEKAEKAAEKDDAKVASEIEADMPDDDDEGEETASYGVEELRDYSFNELVSAIKKDAAEHGGRETSSFCKKLKAELEFRKNMQKDAKEYMNGEMVKPYGIDFYTKNDGEHFAGEMYYTHPNLGKRNLDAYSVNGDFGGTNFGWGRRNAEPDLPAGEQAGQFKRY